MQFCQCENTLQLDIDSKDIFKKKISWIKIDSLNTSQMKENNTQFLSVRIWYLNIALLDKKRSKNCVFFQSKIEKISQNFCQN